MKPQDYTRLAQTEKIKNELATEVTEKHRDMTLIFIRSVDSVFSVAEKTLQSCENLV